MGPSGAVSAQPSLNRLGSALTLLGYFCTAVPVERPLCFGRSHLMKGWICKTAGSQILGLRPTTRAHPLQPLHAYAAGHITYSLMLSTNPFLWVLYSPVFCPTSTSSHHAKEQHNLGRNPDFRTPKTPRCNLPLPCHANPY